MAQHESELPYTMLDQINCEMYDHIRPLDWVNPEIPNPQKNGESIYDMVCIGAGAAGMVTAAGCV